MLLVMVRHGQSFGNLNSSRCRDDTTNFLTRKGELQASLVGASLPFSFDAVYVSPLLRARQTAQIVCNEMRDKARAPLTVVREFHEITEEEGDRRKQERSQATSALYTLMAHSHECVLIVSHYHTMQCLFDALRVEPAQRENSQGKHVPHCQPFLWDSREPEKIYAYRMDLDKG